MRIDLVYSQITDSFLFESLAALAGNVCSFTMILSPDGPYAAFINMTRVASAYMQTVGDKSTQQKTPPADMAQRSGQ